MPRLRAKPHKNQTGMPERGRAMKLGPMETIADLEDTLRILARGMAQLGDFCASNWRRKSSGSNGPYVGISGARLGKLLAGSINSQRIR
jgi:hypothetical protein